MNEQNQKLEGNESIEEAVVRYLHEMFTAILTIYCEMFKAMVHHSMHKWWWQLHAYNHP